MTVVKRKKWGRHILGWLVLLFFLALWESTADLKHIFFMPSVYRIINVFWATWFLSPRFWTDVLPSLKRMGIGYLLAVLIGIGAGTVLGYIPRLFRWFEPIIEFLRSIPPPAIIPFCILILGIGDTMKVFAIAFGCLWPILLNAIDGTRSVNELYIQTGRVFGLNSSEIVRNVVVPAALPQVFVGLKTSLSIALIMMVFSEMVGSYNGLGYFILNAQREFHIDEMYAGIAMLGILGYLLNLVFDFLEKKISPIKKSLSDPS